jgi:hypothetical protein
MKLVKLPFKRYYLYNCNDYEYGFNFNYNRFWRPQNER